MYHDHNDADRVIYTKYKADQRYAEKGNIVDLIFRLYLAKTQKMFEWKNLPKTINQRDLELLVQTNGLGIFVENNGNYFVLYGNLGGLWNQNYMPTRAIIANHYLPDVNGSYEIYRGVDDYKHEVDNLESKGKCVVIPNDPMYMGLTPLLSHYANRLADTYISRRVATFMTRYINVFTAKDDNAMKSVLAFLKDLEDGKLSAIRDTNGMFANDDAVKSLPLAGTSGASKILTELIEAEQYDKASLNNELGLQANYNMKREAINSNESQLNEDSIIPFTDSMLDKRQEAAQFINEIFGLNISVDFSSVWKDKRVAIENSLVQTSGQDEENKNKGDEESGSDGNFGGGASGDNGDNGEHTE